MTAQAGRRRKPSGLAVDASLAANPPQNGADGKNGDTGPAGRGIVGSEPDPADPCVRIIRYDQAPLEERWTVCPPATDPGTGEDETAPPTQSSPTGTSPAPPSEPETTETDQPPPLLPGLGG